MQVEQKSSNDERKILIGLITDRQVLSRVAAQWTPPGLFRTNWCNLIGGWCVDYLNQYDNAPGKAIESIFLSWSETSQDKTSADLMSDFLEQLSEESEEVSSDYLIDLAGKYFNIVRMEQLAEGVQADLSIGKSDRATERITRWNKIELGTGAGVDVTGDMEAIREAFEVKSEPLIEFPGALGEFFGTSLERDGFIAFQAPDKRGKSFWLAEIAYQALLARKRVAYFEAGDLSQHQVIRRLCCRISKRPLQAKTIKYPVRIRRVKGESSPEVITEDKKFDSPLSWQKAWKSAQRLMERRVKSKKTLWRLSCHPNSTLSMNAAKGILATWEREGWVPDVVVFDYADIMASDFSKLEIRHQINECWKQMRALSQSLHCLVVTASQTDAKAYQCSVITRSNFSEDKRKMAHVTGMIGINQTFEEKDSGIYRLNWIVRREGAYSELTCVRVASCLDVANPAVISCW